MESTTNVHTPLAARYLTQLCKHFEHKLTVTHGDGSGKIAFSAGSCFLNASDATLQLRIVADDEAGLAQLEDVVARHLARFAFREPIELTWQRAEA